MCIHKNLTYDFSKTEKKQSSQKQVVPMDTGSCNHIQTQLQP